MDGAAGLVGAPFPVLESDLCREVVEVVGVDIGGTKTAVSVVSDDGRLEDLVTAPTPARLGPQAVLDATASLIRQVARWRTISGIGVGTSGVVDPIRGRIVTATDTIADWTGTEVAQGLRSRLELDPTVPVAACNDVDAHGLGEAWLGAGRGRSSMVMVAVGTGVGGSFIQGDQPWFGSHFLAGEMGHIPVSGAQGMLCPCGVKGHLEAVSAGPAIERAFEWQTGQRLSGREIMTLATHGHARAREVVEFAADALGEALAGTAAMADPECIVVGGGVALAGEEWWVPLRAAYRRHVIPALRVMPILPSLLGPKAAVLGAARLVLNVFEAPAPDGRWPAARASKGRDS